MNGDTAPIPPSAANAKDRVCAIVVTYYPRTEHIEELLAALAGEIDGVLLIDNTPPPATAWVTRDWPRLQQRYPRARILGNGRNLGLGAAYNRGLMYCLEQGFRYALLLDQDSVPAAGMISRLLQADMRLKTQGKAVAALGPRFHDPRFGAPAAFIRIQGGRLRRQHCVGTDDAQIVQADYIISSGSLIELELLQSIGPMDEDLFIDYVDIEWGLRAQGLGYACFGVCGARMKHSLGDQPVPMPLYNKRMLPVRSPLRHYYLFRNAVHLYRRPYLPLAWKLNDGIRLLLKFCFYALITPPRRKNLRYIWRGIRDGLAGRLGEYQER